MNTTLCPSCQTYQIAPDRTTCFGCVELPPITCGLELADGSICDRPSLHAGDHEQSRPFLNLARIILGAVIADA